MVTNPGYALHYAFNTHNGLVRPLNEDALGANPVHGLFVLADGLGGYNAGEVASTMAVSHVLSVLPQRCGGATGGIDEPDVPSLVDAELAALNGRIHQASTNDLRFEGMATTLVAAWFRGDRLWSIHAGDSRLYRLRDGRLTLLTRDHSFSQELLDAGMITEVEARTLPSRHLVTRALGAAETVQPEILALDLMQGDLYLLCSDGLNGMVDDDEIARVLHHGQNDPDTLVRTLVDRALAAGGHDNCSVLVVRVDPVSSEPIPDESGL